MQKEKPTKVYKGSKNQSPKKPKKQGSGFLDNFIKSAKFIVNKAMAGSVQHIAILVAAGVLTVAVVGGAVWGVTSLIGGAGQGTTVNEIEIDPEADNKYDKNASVIDTSKYASTILQETADAGQQYISETLFVGDSNTVRSLMYDVTGNTWENVVGAVGIGIQHVASNPFPCVTFTQPADPVDIVTAIKWIQPKRVVFTFGTNNASWTVDSFIEEYKKAIETAYEAYPYFDVIVNAIPPVDKIRDYPNITMQQIDAFNAALAQMCEDEGYKFLNSAEALKDEETGFAKKDYTIGDGIHLSKNGFTALFDYIRTHAYEAEDRRPELTYCPKRNEIEMPTIIQDPVAIRGGVKVIFTSSDYELGSVDGEVEQYVKYTKTSDAVTAVAKDGAKFTGWSCEYGGISDTGASTVTFTAPMLDEAITEVRVVANFKKDKPDPTPTPVPTATPSATATPGVLEKITIKTAGDVKEVKIGSSLDLSIVTTPEKAQLGTVTWTSSDPTVATVTANGTTNKVTPLKAGKTTIKASTNNGKLNAEVEITVVDPNAATKLTSITLSPVTVEVGKTANISVTCNPSTAKVTNKTYATSDTSVATINSNGVITGVKAGTATITATYDGVVGTTTVTVTAASTPSPAPTTKPAKCEYCGGDAHDKSACTKWCNKCNASGHDEAETHCADCGKTGHADKTSTSCEKYTAPAAKCEYCGGDAHDKSSCAKWCNKCNVSGHDESETHCASCSGYGHADNSTNACPNYVAPKPVCGTCGGEHETSACPKKNCSFCGLNDSHDTAGHTCTGCGGTGHQDTSAYCSKCGNHAGHDAGAHCSVCDAVNCTTNHNESVEGTDAEA